MSILKLAYTTSEARDMINDSVGDMNNYRWAVALSDIPYSATTHRNLRRRELSLMASNPEAVESIYTRPGGITGGILGALIGAGAGTKIARKNPLIGAGIGALAAGAGGTALGILLGKRSGEKASRRAIHSLSNFNSDIESDRIKMLADKSRHIRDREYNKVQAEREAKLAPYRIAGSTALGVANTVMSR